MLTVLPAIPIAMNREEFLVLIEKYLKGTATTTEEQLLDQFFDKQQLNSPILPGVSLEMWTAIQSHIRRSHLRAGISLDKHRRFFQPSYVIAFVLAAIVIIMLVIHREYLFPTKQYAGWITVHAPPGQRSTVTLYDGSMLYLNAASSVAYPEKPLPHTREVKLVGEAFFEIAKDDAKPFLVYSGDVTTSVVGTSFNVQAFEDEKVSVTVATGKVKVSVNKAVSAKDGQSEKSGVILVPNQQAVYNGKDQRLTTAHVDVNRFTAWKDNILEFDDATLEDAAEVLKRWYNITVVLENDQVKKCRIHGRYKNQSLNDVLESIGYMYNIRHRFLNKTTVLLYGKGCH